ncbi:hypothetical protein F4775DRAFT_560932 [Biscogniauxia sp. FL1348]|nr:hypothetical protein F4775DRAFT_560932 [Biscogniauxia sp. FL1348]
MTTNPLIKAQWQSGLMRKTRNLVPSGASVRIRPASDCIFLFCSFFSSRNCKLFVSMKTSTSEKIILRR